MATNNIPEGFVAVEYELPLRDEVYEIYGLFGKRAETLFDSACSAFLPVPGVIGVVAWRECMPDAADIEEFRKREREAREQWSLQV